MLLWTQQPHAGSATVEVDVFFKPNEWLGNLVSHNLTIPVECDIISFFGLPQKNKTFSLWSQTVRIVYDMKDVCWFSLGAHPRRYHLNHDLQEVQKIGFNDGMPGHFSLDAKLKCSTKSMGRLRRVGVEDSEIIMTTLHVKISQITKTTIIATRSYFSSSMLTEPFFKESPRLLQFSRLSRHAA